MDKKKFWLWGYTATEFPATIPFVSEPSYCSLETGAKYLGVDNVIYLNSMHDDKSFNEENFSLIKDKNEIICALYNQDYKSSAKQISELSKVHKNITGAVYDDFYPNAKDIEKEKSKLKEIYENLKSENSNLKLYVVRYEHSPIEEIEPYLDYIDGIIFWVWVSTDSYLRVNYLKDLEKLSKYNKILYQGIFIQNYGEIEFAKSYRINPVDPKLLNLQFEKTAEALDFGLIDGAVILQNGWFSSFAYRENLGIIKDFIAWYNGTRTFQQD